MFIFHAINNDIVCWFTVKGELQIHRRHLHDHDHNQLSANNNNNNKQQNKPK